MFHGKCKKVHNKPHIYILMWLQVDGLPFAWKHMYTQ